MIRKIFLFVAFLLAGVFATPTIIDTVQVPVKIIKLLSITTQGTNQVYNYSGKITYNLRVGAADSLNCSLTFVPVGGGTTITPTSTSGDVGIRSVVNGINGQNTICFNCSITGTPANPYWARITVTGDTSRIEKTVDSLTNLMTLAEKISYVHSSTADIRMGNDITRLGIPGWYMTNGPSSPCHGAGGTSSAFPTGIAMASTFDTALIYQLGIALGKEFYAKGRYIIEGPMINMVRDPRSGRGWEGFGEDPYLSARISVAYSLGAQSVKCEVMPKHFICNDREQNRSSYSANVSERTLREVYAMPFEYSIKEGKAWSVMSAFNLVNGTYCSDNTHILTDILRDDWGFRGFVMSDYGSINNTINSANAGQDAEMPNAAHFGTPLQDAVNAGQVSMTRLDDMVHRIMRPTVWAGLLGKIGLTAVTQYTADLKSAAHQQLALDIARKSIVVVKNEKFGTETAPVLPLNKNTIPSVALIGPYAATYRLNGSGSGVNCPYYAITYLQGMINKLGASKVLDSTQWQSASVVIVCVGVSGEGESNDRTTATLEPPAGQSALVNTVLAAGKKCIVVLTGGSAAVQDVWANAPAIIVAWYPGEEQGNALADIIFGDVNPSGRLAASWPASLSQLPSWDASPTTIAYETPDTGRGQRYYDRCALTPLFCFGHGLSYTTFQYSNLTISPNPGYAGENIVVSVDIQNAGAVAGDEVAQLYIHENAPQLPRPVKELRGFARVTLAPSEKKTVSFTLRGREFAYFDTRATNPVYAPSGQFVVQPDAYTIMVGSSSRNLPLSGTLTLQSPW